MIVVLVHLASLDQALQNDHICVVTSNKQQLIGKKLKINLKTWK